MQSALCILLCCYRSACTDCIRIGDNDMKKEEYKELEIEIIEFGCDDVIVTSPGRDENTPDAWG